MKHSGVGRCAGAMAVACFFFQPAYAVNVLGGHGQKSSGGIHTQGKLGGSTSLPKTTYECSPYSETCVIAVYAAPAGTSIDGNPHPSNCYVAFEFDVTLAPSNTKKFLWVVVDAVEGDGKKYRFADVNNAVDLDSPNEYKDGDKESPEKKYFHWHVKHPNGRSKYKVHVVEFGSGKDIPCDGTDPTIANN